MRFIISFVLIVPRLFSMTLVLFCFNHPVFSQAPNGEFTNKTTLTVALDESFSAPDRVFLSNNMGQSWRELANLPIHSNRKYWGDIGIVSPTVLIAMNSEQQFYPNGADIYLSSNQGRSWETVHHSPKVLRELAVSPDQHNIVAVGAVIVHSNDGGKHWQNTWDGAIDNPALMLSKAVFVDDKVVIVLGNNAHDILRSNDGGEHWATVQLPPDANILGCSQLAVKPDKKYLVVSCYSSNDFNIGLFRSDDRGLSWKFIALPGEYYGFTISGMAYLGDSTLLMTGYFRMGNDVEGLAKQSMDDGVTWQDISGLPKSREALYYHLSTVDQRAMIGAHIEFPSQDTMFFTGDAGQTWKKQPAWPGNNGAYHNLASLASVATPPLQLEINHKSSGWYISSICDNQFRCTPGHTAGYARRWNVPVGDMICVATYSGLDNKWYAYQFIATKPGVAQINFWGTAFAPGYNYTKDTLAFENWHYAGWVKDDNNNGMIAGWREPLGCQCKNCEGL